MFVLDREGWSQAGYHGNQATGFVLSAVWFASLVPSLKSTTPMFLEIYLNQHDDVITLLICIIQKTLISPKWKKDIPKKNTIQLYFKDPFK